MRIDGVGLKKRFGRVEALRGIDFTLQSGQRLGLIGPNASGKSTLIRAMLGLVRCEGGLLIDGAEAKPGDWADRVAYVPQIAPKFSASVKDVIKAITSVRDIDPARVAERGAELGLDLRAIGHQAFRNLSGGAKQKTLISIALATDASLFVLDEPTASLDTTSRKRFFELLQTHTRDATLVLCSHRLEEIRTLVDDVMVLEEGTIAYQGPTEAYLDQITLSTVEVQVLNGRSDATLKALGFEVGTGGWWRRTATRSEKLKLLSDLAALDGGLTNLVVRDAEALHADQEDA